MALTNKELLRRLSQRLPDQEPFNEAVHQVNRARILGLYIQAALKHRRSSPADFARQLDVDPELADAILNGRLPLSELDADLLDAIASVIERAPNLLRLIAGRKVFPASNHREVIGAHHRVERWMDKALESSALPDDVVQGLIEESDDHVWTSDGF